MEYDLISSKINQALSVVKQILDSNRNPQRPSDVPHKYNDKYILAQILTNTVKTHLISGNCISP